ncbi:unnamed protein product [Lathyrus oleraceus]
MKRSIQDSTAPIPKPVFLTKAQHEQQALERRNIRVTGHRPNQEEFILSSNKEREEESKVCEHAQLEKLVEGEKKKEIKSIKEQYIRSKKPKMRVILRDLEENIMSKKGEKLAEEEDVESIKEQYVRSKKPKMRVITPRDIF